MAKRVTFCQHELDAYFDRICLPKDKRRYEVSSLDDNEKLAFLNLLQKHHLVKVPWENLVQHYSFHGTVHLDPRHLFRKIVKSPGRGGYCMENGNYGGWTHVINLVTIAGKRYLLDSGFGGQGPSRPLALNPGVESTQIAPAQMRLLNEPLPHNLDQTQKVWIYQHRYDENGDWTPMYCFVDLEFTPADVGSMNFAPWLSRHTFFTHKVVCVRFTIANETEGGEGPGSPNEAALDGEIDRSITINHDTLKWRKHGEKVVVTPFEKDQDRVEALKKYFGIHLTDAEQEAITNTAAMIGVKAMGVDD